MMYLKITSCYDSASFTYLFLGSFWFRLILVSSLKYGCSVCLVKSGPSSLLILRTIHFSDLCCERSVFFHVDLDDDLSSKSIFFAWPEMCEGPMERI